MNARRETPSPPPGSSSESGGSSWTRTGAVCPLHSGVHERIRDLEGRADSAAREREKMREQITEVRLWIAKWVGGTAAALAVLQVVLRFAGH